MTASLSDVVVPSITASLRTLLGLVAKCQAHAEAKEIKGEALLEARLRPDMYSFAGQIEAATSTAHRGLERIMGKEPSETEAPAPTFEALQTKLQETINFVESVDRGAIDANEATSFQVSFGPKHTMEFTGHSYAYAFLLPNTMFHLSTAYNILRERGVEIGKIDLLGAFVGTFGVKPIT